MAISLTSAGLYLEPRVYVGKASGNNYGVPRVFDGGSVSGLSGSWTGISIGNMGTCKLHSNVSTAASSLAQGGNFLPNSLTTLNQKEVA